MNQLTGRLGLQLLAGTITAAQRFKNKPKTTIMKAEIWAIAQQRPTQSAPSLYITASDASYLKRTIGNVYLHKP